jgi:diacylglycerol kinase family enzyme
VGRIFYRQHDGQSNSRYFIVAAGIGVDAHVMYNLSGRLKRRFGYSMYIAESLRVWATEKYPLFQAEYSANGNGDNRMAQVSQLLAVRIANFGGVLRRLAPGAELRRDDLRLVLFQTRSRLRYLRFLSGILLGREPRLRKIELLDATTVECRSAEGSAAAIYVEADGESLGTLPARIEIVPGVLNLLMSPAKLESGGRELRNCFQP